MSVSTRPAHARGRQPITSALVRGVPRTGECHLWADLRQLGCYKALVVLKVALGGSRAPSASHSDLEQPKRNPASTNEPATLLLVGGRLVRRKQLLLLPPVGGEVPCVGSHLGRDLAVVHRLAFNGDRQWT